MHRLELKIPPPLIGFVIALAMWGLAKALHVFPSPVPRYLILAAAVVAALGVLISAGGILAFKRARTTISPINPGTTSALVTSGVYARTRNPMYLGMLLALTGWALYLASVSVAWGPVLFFLYITRFQIVPEERVLTGLFGSAYVDYCRKVRRWA